ncbi:hypothetical protein ACHFJ0_09080 [Paracoccus sp. NGMCC 1.201697]|uniref:Uncharacterized protein n=1 Tax=Paracoccus broussonetiae subsp. drimophilus TaxID=3373869 RepID=A0ABW7LJ91_9RHOB
MTDDDYLDPEVLRIMRAWPAVYGPGPWSDGNSMLRDGFLCGPGWYPLIARLSADLAVIIGQDGLTRFRVVQVKEKFASLRFYVKGGNERILTRIAEAMREAETTCERCSASACIRPVDGWLSALCDRCHADLR